MQKNEHAFAKEYISLGEVFIQRNDFLKYVKCGYEIDDLTMENKAVPASLIKEFMNYWTSFKYIQNRKFGEQAKQLSIKAVERIKKFKNPEKYEFNGKSSRTFVHFEAPGFASKLSLPQLPSKELYHYSLNTFFEEAIINYLTYEYENLKIFKDDAIRFFYPKICGFKESVNKKHKKELTPYKIRILSGVLTEAVGHMLGYKKDLKPKEIFDFTRNALKKMK